MLNLNKISELVGAAMLFMAALFVALTNTIQAIIQNPESVSLFAVTALAATFVVGVKLLLNRK
ncbi:hypothetical protein LMH73_007340 [Vibrio splendidus]|nr:hypothetical protein [Vibrio splendidus]MCC4883133.1 hypothetical protein [Vibrio splendidus]